MKVLIVAKTRQGSGACIGGITFEGQSVRLIAADAEWNETAGMEYEVGEVWELEATPAKELIPPHVENIVVKSKRKMPPLEGRIQFIKRHMPPVEGGPDVLYEGLTRATRAGGMYIAEGSGVPSHSTTFWIPDRPLVRDEEGMRIHYRYPDSDGGRRLTFVGFQEPPETIPAGTLLRVSLAHWWRPQERSDLEFRCYVQLSGWFEEDAEEYFEYAEVNLSEPAVKRKTTSKPARRSAPGMPLDMDQAQELLEVVFGYDSFWPLQADVIANLLNHRDTLAIMPTGSGKSLCYQLPALMFGGLTVVVSPLISLMQDQVDQLRELEAPAVFLNSTLSHSQYVTTANRVRGGEVKLLYLAPETLLRPETLVMLDASQVDCLTIDEAHCISSWGHDFRPEYRKLLPVRDRYKEAVCFALTATATERVQRDISDILGFEDSDEFIASFDRKNLLLAARPRTDGLDQIRTFLEEHRDQSGIIYCSTRKQVDELAWQLSQEGWSALPYHAGMEDHVRRKHQRQFVRDDVQIVVATIAFGMGIDKSNVRFVVHANMPEDIESYYQQIGRAGRDGLQADCLLLYSVGDLVTYRRFIDKGAESERAGREARLQAMMRYAQAGSCRRIPLLGYFGESFTGHPCGMCDYCLAQEEVGERTDVTIAAQKFLSCVKRTGEIFGAGHIIKVLRGSHEKRVIERRHDRLSTYGIGMEHSTKQWKLLGQRFIEQGLLKQDLEHGGLGLTPKAYDVFNGEKVLIPLGEEWLALDKSVRPRLGEPARPRFREPERPEYDQELFNQLRALRKELADEADVPAYVVFSDRALSEMAAYYPQSKGNFLAISGVGEAKLEKYGARFMSLIGAYCREREIEEGTKPLVKSASSRSGKRSSRRSNEVGELFASGQSISQLQERYGVKKGTIVSHLYRFHQTGHDINARRVLEASELTAEEQKKVMAAFSELGPERLRPIFDALEERISFDELHIMRLYYLNRA